MACKPRHGPSQPPASMTPRVWMEMSHPQRQINFGDQAHDAQEGGKQSHHGNGFRAAACQRGVHGV